MTTKQFDSCLEFGWRKKQDRLYKYKDLVEAHLQQYCTTGTGT
jgi:hypothetical protein